MRALQLEFGRVRRAAPAWAIVLFVLALGACAFAVWRLSAAQAQLAQARQARTQKADLLQLRTPAVAPNRPYVLAPDRVAAINRAVQALNLPWEQLFAAVEGARTDAVALLNLEPDGARQTLRLVAEARTPADMLAFVDRLSARPELAAVALIKHEVQERDPNRPLRFQVDAQWKVSP